MIQAVGLEFRKMKRRFIWLLPLGGVLIQAYLLSAAVSTLNENVREIGWLYLFYQVPFFNSLLLPVAIAAIASRICEIEHKGSALKQLKTMISPTKLFLAKLLSGWFYMVVISAAQILLMALIASHRHFTQLELKTPLLIHFGGTMFLSMTIYLIHQILSLQFANQLISFALGLSGSFVGLLSLFFPPVIQRFFLWSYYGVLAQVSMDWNKVTRATKYLWNEFDIAGWLMLTTLFFIILLAGILIFRKREE